MTLNPFKWARAFITYQRSDVFGNFAGPTGYQPRAMSDDTQILSVQEQQIDEAHEVDPDPTIALGVK
jgi:hypothetical protein